MIFKLLLQLAGITMIALALSHVGLSKLLAWREDTKSLKPINQQVFIVHTVFLAIGIFLLGLVCLLDTSALMEKTALGLVASACFSVCWLSRLLCQIFIFRSEITSDKRINFSLQAAGMALWIFYTALFAALFLFQSGVISD